MKISHKILLPQAVAIIFLGCLSVVIISSSFKSMKTMHIATVVNSAFESVLNKVENSAKSAQETAALFAGSPEIIEAFTIAHTGDISDERSEQSQAARDHIREFMHDELSNYKSVSGKKLRLHFHLPNGRSLVRLWRDKQAKRSGQWVDISDDISSFRQTVLDVNRQGLPLGGIELGRGGFAIRGLVPVKDNTGKILGSAEVLNSFAPILQSVKDAGMSAMLFMNKDKLSTATSLKDTSKYPIVGSDYVFVSGTNKNKDFSIITKDLLDKSRNERVVIQLENSAIATLPVRDYLGKQIGVLVGIVDLNEMAALSGKANKVLLGCVAAMLIIPLLMIYFTLRGQVVKPVEAIRNKIKDINEDRADLSSHINIKYKDEIGSMTEEFNSLLGKISTMVNEMQLYVDVVNSVPDPIFVVDKDFNLIFANKPVIDFTGMTEHSLKSSKCHNIFNSDICNTNKCPVEMSRRSGKREITETTKLTDQNGNTIYVQPVSDSIKDSNGEIVGYFEVARIVTELVLKENDINKQLQKINDVHESVREASNNIFSRSEEMGREVDDVDSAATDQQRLLSETVAAFGQMNASVLDIAENASLAAGKTQETRDKAEEGARIVMDASTAINSVQTQTETMRASMTELEEQAEKIGTVLNVINDIADQTNLLALNAAIEAARAGDAGRGFAVVADEVRKLAEKTVEATKEVETVIIGIQNQAGTTRQLTEKTNNLAEQAAEFANISGKSLQSIVDLAHDSASSVSNIATAAEEQSASSEQINRAMSEVNELAVKVADRVKNSVESLNGIIRLAEKLGDEAGK
ncbi:methyl-accepting chemotaxis protein [Maridesulfovibrio salexigens]|uniref:Methyl-accepting chemotaxis sensory transducer with Pas/Pac sensor n=1 Tax=Maridesulfovibrio salexigens (strain ATCC 14822 / DSM 2638 / NCIMB 8403 / VKM B-1763) TaxID=526222 RepID=C6BXB1_MARSD|nr:methyl-accepting chemotaxis protein [Maridesulfovibrio salexigens]ACS80417.1 methyl-accepting chemotaxis sensory transducer with Pas/Pac sensor [Maridesulfovibrio salexigens DSM 2638]